MAISKIVKYNLEDEARQLKEMHYTNEEIARRIRESHPEIEDLRDLAGMSIGRFFKLDEGQKIEQQIIEGQDPVDNFIKEYRDKINKIEEQTNDIFKECRAILDEAKATGDITDKVKAVDVVLKSLEQSRRNLVSLVQYGERQTANFGAINLKKEYYVKNLLLDFSKGLCAKCRAKIPEILEGENNG